MLDFIEDYLSKQAEIAREFAKEFAKAYINASPEERSQIQMEVKYTEQGTAVIDVRTNSGNFQIDPAGLEVDPVLLKKFVRAWGDEAAERNWPAKVSVELGSETITADIIDSFTEMTKPGYYFLDNAIFKVDHIDNHFILYDTFPGKITLLDADEFYKVPVWVDEIQTTAIGMYSSSPILQAQIEALSYQKPSEYELSDYLNTMKEFNWAERELHDAGTNLYGFYATKNAFIIEFMKAYPDLDKVQMEYISNFKTTGNNYYDKIQVSLGDEVFTILPIVIKNMDSKVFDSFIQNFDIEAKASWPEEVQNEEELLSSPPGIYTLDDNTYEISGVGDITLLCALCDSTVVPRFVDDIQLVSYSRTVEFDPEVTGEKTEKLESKVRQMYPNKIKARVYDSVENALASGDVRFRIKSELHNSTHAFFFCHKDGDDVVLDYGGNNADSIRIPDGITVIGADAFAFKEHIIDFDLYEEDYDNRYTDFAGQTVFVPESVTQINCPVREMAASNLIIEGNSQILNSEDFHGVIVAHEDTLSQLSDVTTIQIHDVSMTPDEARQALSDYLRELRDQGELYSFEGKTIAGQDREYIITSLSPEYLAEPEYFKPEIAEKILSLAMCGGVVASEMQCYDITGPARTVLPFTLNSETIITGLHGTGDYRSNCVYMDGALYDNYDKTNEAELMECINNGTNKFVYEGNVYVVDDFGITCDRPVPYMPHPSTLTLPSWVDCVKIDKFDVGTVKVSSQVAFFGEFEGTISVPPEGKDWYSDTEVYDDRPGIDDLLADCASSGPETPSSKGFDEPEVGDD